jgi:hypothetical protein
MEQAGEDVGAALVASGEAAEAHQPGDCPFDDPTMASQTFGGLNAFASDADADPPSSEIGATARDVVRLVSMKLGRSEAWPSWLPARTDDGWDRLDQRLEDARIVQVRCRQLHGQRNALAVHNQVVLGAQLPTVSRVPPGRCAPFLARTLVLSRLTRSQSILPSSPSQFRMI